MTTQPTMASWGGGIGTWEDWSAWLNVDPSIAEQVVVSGDGSVVVASHSAPLSDSILAPASLISASLTASLPASLTTSSLTTSSLTTSSLSTASLTTSSLTTSSLTTSSLTTSQSSASLASSALVATSHSCSALVGSSRLTAAHLRLSTCSSAPSACGWRCRDVGWRQWAMGQSFGVVEWRPVDRGAGGCERRRLGGRRVALVDARACHYREWGTRTGGEAVPGPPPPSPPPPSPPPPTHAPPSSVPLASPPLTSASPPAHPHPPPADGAVVTWAGGSGRWDNPSAWLNGDPSIAEQVVVSGDGSSSASLTSSALAATSHSCSALVGSSRLTAAHLRPSTCSSAPSACGWRCRDVGWRQWAMGQSFGVVEWRPVDRGAGGCERRRLGGRRVALVDARACHYREWGTRTGGEAVPGPPPPSPPPPSPPPPTHAPPSSVPLASPPLTSAPPPAHPHPPPADGAVVTWAGGSGRWDNPSAWLNGDPSIAEQVVVSGDGSVVVASHSWTRGRVTIGSGARVRAGRLPPPPSPPPPSSPPPTHAPPSSVPLASPPLTSASPPAHPHPPPADGAVVTWAGGSGRWDNPSAWLNGDPSIAEQVVVSGDGSSSASLTSSALAATSHSCSALVGSSRLTAARLRPSTCSSAPSACGWRCRDVGWRQWAMGQSFGVVEWRAVDRGAGGCERRRLGGRRVALVDARACHYREWGTRTGGEAVPRPPPPSPPPPSPPPPTHAPPSSVPLASPPLTSASPPAHPHPPPADGAVVTWAGGSGRWDQPSAWLNGDPSIAEQVVVSGDGSVVVASHSWTRGRVTIGSGARVRAGRLCLGPRCGLPPASEPPPSPPSPSPPPNTPPSPSPPPSPPPPSPPPPSPPPSPPHPSPPPSPPPPSPPPPTHAPPSSVPLASTPLTSAPPPAHPHPPPADGAVVTWAGGSGRWDNPSAWLNGDPSIAEQVVVSGDGSVVVASHSWTRGRVTIGSGARVRAGRLGSSGTTFFSCTYLFLPGTSFFSVPHTTSFFYSCAAILFSICTGTFATLLAASLSCATFHATLVTYASIAAPFCSSTSYSSFILFVTSIT
ncbi:hypothetical protein AB1Y20_007821 [Prymnesium parvum]|uniref:Uncharacterized protein n=1 Tax=Prymnesium parvum TaxID=97485 RepID=A0AB34IT05_PRYPA